MAQGVIKKPSVRPAVSATAGGRNKPQQRRGATVAKSKRTTSADKLQKKHAAGLTARTEKLLGERAGHLELIGKGKKGKLEKGKDGEKSKTGGTRKFG
ncbi:DUF2462 domain-containing protein [Microdochium nivale]|nr:DUF2462 domain-containing protein [Microdochium nivale]